MNEEKRPEGGFTLIEVAIVLIIGGILLSTASALLLTYMKKVQIATTESRLGAIDEALELFLSLNGRYPCAAVLNAPIDSAEFGVEISGTDCAAEPSVAGETTQVAGRGGRTVRIGAVPVRTLNLPDDFIGDAWGGRFTYAVTEMLATPGTYDRNEGGIFVVDSDNPADPIADSVITPPGSGHYVVISHGANNSGATALPGGGATPCTAGTLEEENCNGDATFRRSLLVGTAENASLYDDFLSVRASSAFGNQAPAGAVMAFELNACPQGWVAYTDADGRAIFGAGATYTLGETGGVDEWTLTEAEMGFNVSPTPIDPTLIPGPVYFAESPSTPALPDPHENRPPFIALLYCKKT